MFSINKPDINNGMKIIQKPFSVPKDVTVLGINDNIADFLKTMSLSLGCDQEEKTNLVGSLCYLLNGWIGDLGGDPVNPPQDPQCDADGDCYEWQDCEDGKCIDDNDHCYVSGECEGWEICDIDTGDCNLRDGMCENETDCPADLPCEDNTCCLPIDAECISGIPCCFDLTCREGSYPNSGLRCLPECISLGGTCYEYGSTEECCDDLVCRDVSNSSSTPPDLECAPPI